MTRYGMVIDTKRCVGCNACSVNCKITNNLPETNWWTRVLTEGGDEIDTPAGVFPDVSMRYITVGCQHCENPACTKVCPVGATYKDPETGVVRQDYDKCIGCRMCMAACPYTGVRSFNWEEPKYPVDHAVGDADVPKHQKHVVEKCRHAWSCARPAPVTLVTSTIRIRRCRSLSKSAPTSSCWPAKARSRPCTTSCKGIDHV